MKTLRLSLLSLGVSLISATTLITPVVAQTPDSEPELPSETGSADDLRVSPRGGVGFTTTGAGYEDPFFSLEGFIPLQQNPGSTLTFLEGKFLVSTDSSIGGNVLLGQRFYSLSQDQILGGYISYDFRDTGNSSFNQIGAGFELLSKDFDLRINGYLPIGDRRQQVAESYSNPNFEGNFLLLDRDRRFESAVGGLDLEVGTQLARLGEGGLRGYAGVYYYNAPGGDDGLGIRGRLEASPSDNLQVGLLVQHDPVFDTSVALSLRASFPGTRPRGADRNSTLARIGESVGRTSIITVDEQEEFETVTATNPTTNEPYRFQHVNVGTGSNNGTFETPFATVQDALTIAQPNDIVYVQATEPGILPFTIPENVSVISAGPVQLIDTVETGNVQLPFSGSGVLPTISGTVVLGNNTELSGFSFINPVGNAIEGTNISDATIRDNVITDAAQSGISLTNVSGTTTVANNTIIDSNAGISLNNNTGSVDLNIDGNSLTNNLENITVGLIDTAVGTVGVVENTVTGGGIGVGVEVGGNSLVDVIIGSNTVNNTTETGIAVDVLGQAQVDATISDNTLTNNLENIGVGLVETAIGTVGIVENEVTGGGLGINVDVAGNSVLTGSIGNNTVNNTTETGIAVDVLGQAQVNATINDNTLTDNVENIGVGLVETAVGTVNIVENEVTGGGLGINVDVAGNSVLTGSIGNNTVNNTTETGIAIDALEQGQLVNVIVSGNSLINNLENITVGLVDTATGTVDIVENTVTGGGIGVGVEAAGNSLLDVNIGSNTVNNATETGIAVDALGQAQVDATISDNTLTNNVENIRVGLVETAVGTVNIVENEVTGGGLGINVDVAGNSVLTGSIGNNTVNNTTETGIAVDALEQGQLVNVIVSGNSLSNNPENIGVGLTDTATGTVDVVNNEVTGGGLGINVDVAGNSVLTGTIGNNTVEDTTQTAIDVDVLEQGQLANVTISDNSLSNNPENISVGLDDTAVGTVNIVENEVTGGGLGINVDVAGNSVLTGTIGNNTVENTTQTAIDVDALEQGQLVNVTVSDNSLSNNPENISVGLTDTATGTVDVVNNEITGGGLGINVDVAGNSVLTGTIGNNTVEDTTQTGIAVDALEQGQLVNVTVSDNSLSNNTENISVGLDDTAVGTVNIVENEVTGGGLGINVDVAGNSVLTGNIGNNTVEDTTQTGIAVDALEQGQLTNVTISGNSLTNNEENIGVDLTDTATGTVDIVANQVTEGSIGITVEVAGDSTLTGNIGSNSVSNTSETGIAVEVSEQGELANVSVNGNSLTNNEENIVVNSTDTATGTVDVVANQVTGGEAGISVEVAGDSTLTGNIGSNSVSNTTETGIAVEVSEQGELANVSVNGNSLTNNEENIVVNSTDTATGAVDIVANQVTGGDTGISIEGGGTSAVEVNIDGNGVQATTGDAINVSTVEQTQVDATISNNTLDNNANGVSVDSTGATQGTVTVVNNDVSNTLSGVGVAVALAENAALVVGIGDNSVDTPPGTGIIVQAAPTTTATLTVDPETTANLQVTGNPVISVNTDVTLPTFSLLLAAPSSSTSLP